MFGELGELVGTLAIVFYAISVASFLVKFINRKFGKYLHKISWISKTFKLLMKIIVRYHYVFGFITFVLILFHFSIQYSSRGLSYTGVTAAGIMLLQVLIGYIMKHFKKRTKIWLYSHRLIAVIIVVALIIHIA